MNNEEFYCVLSGVTPRSVGADEGDELGEMPSGWIKLTVQRRYENPQWVLIQQIKATSVDQMLSQIPEEQQEDMREVIQLQVDAVYCGLEDRVGQYITDEEVRYIADPTDNRDLFSETKILLDKLEIDLEDLSLALDEQEEE